MSAPCAPFRQRLRAMNAVALLDELHAAGFRLTAHNARLHVTPPPTGCPDDLRARIVAHKPVLLELVRMRDHLLALAREIGVPDQVVLGLPATELQATVDQLPLWPAEDLQRKVLVVYLRALAGIEPALEGTIAARDAHHRQVQATGMPPNGDRP